jgi:hypothetical protein
MKTVDGSAGPWAVGKDTTTVDRNGKRMVIGGGIRLLEVVFVAL